jgi:AcrR family transcriptional regulator
MWRERIIETALILGDSHGDDALTSDLVARASGLSRAHLYTFFPNRPELHRAVVSARGRAMAEDLVSRVERARGLEPKLRRLVEEVFRLTAAHERKALRNGTSTGGLGELLCCMRAAAAEPIGRELAGGASSLLIGHAVIAMSEGAAIAWAEARRPNRQAAVDTAVRFIRGVLRVSSRATDA